MKGVSNIIAIILVLLIVVSLAALVYIWMTGLADVLFNIGGNQTEQFGTMTGAQLKIETFSFNVIFIRNIGQSKLTDFFVSVNGIPVAFTASPTELESGVLGNLTLTPVLTGVKPSGNSFEITTAQGATATGKISGFTGQVLKNSMPVASATVNVLASGSAIGSTTTDSNGNYVIYISPGTYDLQATSGSDTEVVPDRTITSSQIKTVDINLGGTIEPGPMTYDLFIYGRGYTCNTPEYSHKITINGIQAIMFDPCATFGTSYTWASFDVTDFVTQGTNSFDIRDTSSWTNSNFYAGVDNSPDGNSDIHICSPICTDLSGELMIYINACNNLGCTQYRSDNDIFYTGASLDFTDDWAIKRIDIP